MQNFGANSIIYIYFVDGILDFCSVVSYFTIPRTQNGGDRIESGRSGIRLILCEKYVLIINEEKFVRLSHSFPRIF
jgi:hypothetical protein